MSALQKTPLLSKLMTMLAKDEQHSPVTSSENAIQLLTEAETMAVSGGPETEVGAGGDPN
ncbi:MAG: hypothetical protein V4488_23965 [Pseudomonadota bacterium]